MRSIKLSKYSKTVKLLKLCEKYQICFLKIGTLNFQEVSLSLSQLVTNIGKTSSAYDNNYPGFKRFLVYFCVYLSPPPTFFRLTFSSPSIPKP